MLPLAWATAMIGFEPEPAEAAALQGGDPAPWKSRQIIVAAVGGLDGPATLHIPTSPDSASLLPHNEEMIEWFGVSEQHAVKRTIAVDTRTLDGLLSDGGIAPADYIKIDVEGAEGAILGGATRYLETTLALRVEVSFLEQRVGQPLGWDVGRQLQDQGFLIVDLIEAQHWRARRQAGHPFRTRGDLPWSRPMLAQGDLIAIRDFRPVTDAVEAAKLVLITAALGYLDFADVILRHHSALVAPLAAEYGMDLSADLRAASAALGRDAPGTALRESLRGLVPLGRSLVGGLPAS
jgi:FkbM family methyltransferase